VVSPQASELGTRLDAHHLPETNGRIAVCRRCGSRTDAADGVSHIPAESQLLRSSRWLASQSHMTRLAEARTARNS